MYNNLQIGVTENLTSSGDFEMSSQRVKIVEGGKLVIPAAFRRELGINPGDTVIVEMAEGELRVRSIPSAIRRAQELVKQFNPDGRSMVDELIADRRAEAERE
ncbi:AbrB/MazE/SpoVT family DNA-binding domain-containing protein [Fulvimarina manganoxydans]|nr:AbrB/MazE/SpoVT family DNA-binding domain-containing protein [Fulvimarina manganoxydans]